MDPVAQARARARLRRIVKDGTARAVREAAAVSQHAMARKLGKDRGTFIRWENGNGEPRDIADVLAWLKLLDAMAAELKDDLEVDLIAALGTGDADPWVPSFPQHVAAVRALAAAGA